MGILAKLFQRRPRASVREELVVVVFATAQDGVSAEEAIRLREIFNAAEPIGWWFLNPGSFFAIFDTNASGREKSSAITTHLRNLRMNVPALSELRMGVAEGPVVVSRDANGAIDSLPIGATVNTAVRAALETAAVNAL